MKRKIALFGGILLALVVLTVYRLLLVSKSSLLPRKLGNNIETFIEGNYS